MTRAHDAIPARARIAALAVFAFALGALATLAPASAERGPKSVSAVAEALIPAVVNISTSQTVKGPQGVPLPRVPKGSPFEEFFEEFFNRRGGGPAPADRKVSSLGSGFVVDGKQGLIVTNHHVIEGADEIIVNFHDGSKLKVDKVLGMDTKTDLALLKVTPEKPLAEVRFGSSENMKVGDWVMAIGNPFGLGGSVTVGIISAKQRDIQSGPYDDFLQTDAAINKGNSGGPLFNMEGEVIGVNTAIISPTGGSIGIGFAVPADTATSVVDQLREYGETRRGWLGVKIQSVTEDIAESLGVSENTGALVASVSPGGPAEKAGIEAGDVIVTFDGKAITSMRTLPRVVAQTPIGKSVNVDVLRKGQRMSFSVEVGRLSEEGEASAGNDDQQGGTADEPQAGERWLLGLKLAPLTDALRAQHGFDAKVKGVIVLEVDAASQASGRNIKAGEVVVEAAQEPVAELADLVKAIERMKSTGRKQVLLRIEDNKGDMRFVAVPIE